MIQVNEDVLRRAVQAIELNLPKWNQNEWANKCKTTACLAGWILTTEAGMTLAQIETLSNAEYDGSLEGPAAKALDLLGVTGSDDRNVFNDAVFYYTSEYTACCDDDSGECDCDDDGYVTLGETRQSLGLLKARLTEVTGVTF